MTSGNPVFICHEYMFANKRWFDKSRFAAANGSVDEWRIDSDFHVPVFDPYRHTTIPIGAWIDHRQHVPILGARDVEPDFGNPRQCQLLLAASVDNGSGSSGGSGGGSGGAGAGAAELAALAPADEECAVADREGGAGIKPLRWVTLGAGICPVDGAMLLDGLAGRAMVFIGDEVVQQLFHAYLCILAEHGTRPVALRYGRGGIVSASYEPPGGGSHAQIRWCWLRQYEPTRLASCLRDADLVIAGMGRMEHYRNRGVHERLVRKMVSALADWKKQDCKAAMLIESLPTHYPTYSQGTGEYDDPIGDSYLRPGDVQVQGGRVHFVPLPGQEAERWQRQQDECRPKNLSSGWTNWRNQQLRKAGKELGVKLLDVEALLFQRHDAHPQRAANGQLDCTHWCGRTSIFVPVIERINHDVVRGIYDPCFTKKAYKKNWEGVTTSMCHPCRPDEGGEAPE